MSSFAVSQTFGSAPAHVGGRGSRRSSLQHTCPRIQYVRPRAARRSVCVRAEKEPFRVPKWDTAWNYLVNEREFSSSQAEDVMQQVDSGSAVLIDVRPAARYEEAHPRGAVNIPLYQKTDFSKFSFTRYLKGLALLANGVEPVEANPDFMEQLKEAVGNKAVCLMCETGGTLSPNASFPTGKVSRSLLATHRVVQSGEYPSVMHLSGGAYGWARARLPFDGEYDEKSAGRTPNVVS